MLFDPDSPIRYHIGAELLGRYKITPLTAISGSLRKPIIGIIYARYEGLNTLRSGFTQLLKDEVPAYEIISGAAIAFAAFLLILPGFATDVLGFLIILPLTRKLIFKKLFKNFKKEKYEKKTYIDGEYEEIKDDDERKF